MQVMNTGTATSETWPPSAGREASAKRMPLISVVVPVYNVEPYLRRCLESICRQTYSHLEIICVNDGSTDGSLAILREYEARDIRICVIDKPNGGLSSARNVGIDLARGEWVAGVDPDDYLLPEAYSKALSCATDEVDLVVFGTRVEAEPGSGLELIAQSKQRYFKMAYAGICELDEEHIRGHDVVFWNKLYRRSLLEKHHTRFDEGLRTSEDLCFHYRFCARAGKAAFCPTPLYVYILRRGSLLFSGKEDGRHLSDYLRCMDTVATLYTELGLVEAYGKVLLRLLEGTRYFVDMWSYYIARPLEYRERLLQHARLHRMHECAATAPVVAGLEEAYCRARRMVDLLREGALRAAPVEKVAAALHVAIPADEAHAGRALLLAQSLRATAAAGCCVCVYFICNEVSAGMHERMAALAGERFSVRVCDMPADILQQLPPLRGDHAYAAYLRMALPWMLPDVGRVLVLLPGLLVRGVLPVPDASAMAGKPVAVVKDYPLAGRYQAAVRLGLDGYDSADVLLMDLAMMREQGGAEPWAVASAFATWAYPQAGTDSFNIAFRGRIAYLPAEWAELAGPAAAEELPPPEEEQGRN